MDPAALGRLRAALEEEPRVEFAYLFGSQATGTAGPRSDVDVAAWFREPLTGDEQLDLMGLVTGAVKSDRVASRRRRASCRRTTTACTTCAGTSRNRPGASGSVASRETRGPDPREARAVPPLHNRVVELRKRLAEPSVDWVVWSAAERNLQLALESAIDVGEMIISWKGLHRPEENRDVFRVLGEAGILEDGLARRMADAAGMRNILVHEYGRLDPEKVRRAFLHDVKYVEEFAIAVARLVA